MSGYSAKSIRLLTAVCTLFFAALSGALAMEQQFPDDNCAITIPDTWLVMTNYSPQPGLLAVYSDATGNRRLILQIINKKPPGPLDDRFIAEFEKGYQESGGGVPLSGKYIEVDGIKSYERLGGFVLQGKQISTMIRLVPGEDRYYNMHAMRFDGDASEDPELRQVIDSFRFIHPFVPSYAPDSISYQIGKLTGALLIVIAVVAVVFNSLRSNRTSRPPPILPKGH